MKLKEYPFHWAFDNDRWVGEFSEFLREYYIWFMFPWPVRIVATHFRCSFIELPPDVQDERPEELPTTGCYVPPSVFFKMGVTSDVDPHVKGFIYVS